MIIEHDGAAPQIDPSAYVAPNAVISGNVTIGAGSRILFGAVLTSEGGPIAIGGNCIVMENALIRGTARHPARIGNNVLLGPRSCLSGCTIEDNVFVATGATVFNGAKIGSGSMVRINGVVHIRSTLPPGSVVPIGWIAVGDPAEILPPHERERYWSLMEPLDFTRTVFGLERTEPDDWIPKMTARYGKALAKHEGDRVIHRA